MAQAIKHYIQKHNLMALLPAEMLRELRLTSVEAGGIIDLFHADTPLLCFLVDGAAEVVYDHLNGRQSTVGHIEPLAMLGELDLFYQPKLDLTCVAREACTLLVVDMAIARQFGAEHPPFLHLIINNLSEKLTRSTFVLRNNILPVAGQLAAYLLEAESGPDGLIPIPGKPFLSELMGTTPRHINRSLNTLEADELIRLETGGIVLLDRAGLAALLE